MTGFLQPEDSSAPWIIEITMRLMQFAFSLTTTASAKKLSGDELWTSGSGTPTKI